VADDPKTCANCGHTQGTGTFCEACGTRLPQPAAAASPAPPAPGPAVAPPPPPMTPPPPAVAPVYAQQPPYAPAPGAQPYPPAYPSYPPPPSPLMEHLNFKRMLMPGLAVVAFWLFEGLSLFYWIRMIYYGHRSALEVIFNLVGLFIAALLIRIFMETVVTIFKQKG